MTATTKSTKNQPATAANLLPQEICDEVLLEKYAKGNEKNIFDVRARVARALAAMEPEDKRAVWEARFLEAQEKGFVPAGRINSAAGTNLAAKYPYQRAYLPVNRLQHDGTLWNW